jgi:WD40 repeat protein
MGNVFGKSPEPLGFYSHREASTSVAFAPHGDSFATCSDDGTIRRYQRGEALLEWDEVFDTAPLPSRPNDEGVALKGVAYGGDNGSTLVAVGTNCSVYSDFDVDPRSPSETITGLAMIEFAKFTADGKRLLIVATRRGKRVCEVINICVEGKLAGSRDRNSEFTTMDESLHCATTSNVRSEHRLRDFIVVAGSSTVSKYFTSGSEEVVGSSHSDIVDVDVAADDSMILSVGKYNDSPACKIWDASSKERELGTCIAEDITAAESAFVEVTCARFAPSGNVVVVGFSDGSIRFFDVAGASRDAGTDGSLRGDRACSQIFSTRGAHARRITALAFAPQGECVVSTSADKSVCVHAVPSACLTDDGNARLLGMACCG